MTMSSLGGYYLPAGDAPRSYSDDAPLANKLACEIAPVIEDFVLRHGDELGPHAFSAPAAGAPPPWMHTASQFHALTTALQGLGKGAAAVYVYFSSLPDPDLKLLGIQGRLEAGDASALLDLVKNLAVVAPAFNRASTPLTSMGVDVRGNLPAAHALGRMAVGETSVPGIEGGAASQLASTGSPEFLPYLMVMLESPNAGTRDLALMSFCPLLQDRKLWTPEMPAYCPARAPLNDPAGEQKDIRFWKDWWQDHRTEIGRPSPCPISRCPRDTTSRRRQVGSRSRSLWRSGSSHCSVWPAVTPTIPMTPAVRWCQAPDRVHPIRSHRNSRLPIVTSMNRSARR
ncbi:MAG TPA: hypothetical protein VHW09_01905 [Bryobacteraceae bacterium]|jgi:hypothetical protein|nr:hypothetical protein [Bryobacteraceae bacterium]